MFCPNCGKRIPEHVNFCPNCGTNIKQYLENTSEDNPHGKKEFTQNYSFLEDNVFADDLSVSREDDVKEIDKDDKNELFSNTSYFDIEDVFYVLDDEEELAKIKKKKKAKEEKKKEEDKFKKELERQRLLDEERKRKEENEVFVSVDYEEEDEKDPVQKKFNTMKQRIIDEQNFDETIHEPIPMDGLKDEKEKKTDKDIKKDFKNSVDNAKGYVNKFMEFLKKKTKIANEKYLSSLAKKGNTAGKFYNIIQIALLILLTLTPITLFVSKNAGLDSSMPWIIIAIIIFLITELATNIFIQFSGIKMASFYMEDRFDKSTNKSYIIFTSTVFSLIKFLFFIFLKVPLGIGAILSQNILGTHPIIMIIVLILDILLISATLWDRYKEKNYFKILLMIAIGIILSYMASYLIGSTLVRVFIGNAIPELL